MPLYFPKNIAGLAMLGSKNSTSYALGALRVIDPGDGTYRVEVTDGRRLAIVRGPCAKANYPALENATNGASQVLVSAEDWKNAFRLGGKGHVVGLAAAEETLTLAVLDQALVGKPLEGRFPPVDSVLPTSGALLRVQIDPSSLRGLLNVAAALEPDEGVALLYFGKDKPLGVMCRNSDGQTFDALIMPLVP
jgi:hypothetical protein